VSLLSRILGRPKVPMMNPTIRTGMQQVCSEILSLRQGALDVVVSMVGDLRV
jgi:hypothetical protein